MNIAGTAVSFIGSCIFIIPDIQVVSKTPLLRLEAMEELLPSPQGHGVHLERVLRRTLFRVMKMQAVNKERLRWQDWYQRQDQTAICIPQDLELQTSDWSENPILGLSLADVKSGPAHDTGACHVVFYSCMNTTVLSWHQTRWSKTQSGGNMWW